MGKGLGKHLQEGQLDIHLELQDRAEALELCKAMPLEVHLVVPCQDSHWLGTGLLGTLDVEAEGRLREAEQQDMQGCKQEGKLGLEGPLGQVDLGLATW